MTQSPVTFALPRFSRVGVHNLTTHKCETHALSALLDLRGSPIAVTVAASMIVLRPRGAVIMVSLRHRPTRQFGCGMHHRI